MKRSKIINDGKTGWYPFHDKLEDKERLLSQQCSCTQYTGRSELIVWVKDAYQDEPHVHIIDERTHGNRVNWAYSMITGKALTKKHGTMIKPVSQRYLDEINKLIRIPIYGICEDDRWRSALIDWNAENATHIHLNRKCPTFTN